MGKEYFKRPLMTDLTTAGSTVASVSDLRVGGALTVTGALTQTGNLVLNSLQLGRQSLTASTALQSLSSTLVAHFLTQGTSGAGRDFRLPAPTAGAMHFVSWNANTTSPDNMVVFTNTTAQTFFGTTFNQIRPATGSTAAAVKGRLSALFVGVSTSQWAVLPGGTTTALVMAASTGSTGQ